MEIIRVEGIYKSYGKHQVHQNLTLSVNKGECFTILGPSGCGKTVLLRLIAGFEVPSAGKIVIGDTVVTDPDNGVYIQPDRRGLGVVFQDYAVWPHMTVFDNVGYPLKIAKAPEKELKERVMNSIELVGMKGLEKRLPSELSGGQQQRVALARALIANSSLMLLDEPLSNLDANLREEMRFEIKQLQKALGITILYVTHDQEVALAISDRIAVMDEQGNIRQTGSPQEIFEQPADAFVFRFMGVTNMLPVTVREGYYELEDGQHICRSLTSPVPADIPLGTQGFLGFRPSDIGILSTGQGLRVKVLRNSFLGALTELRVELAGQEIRTQTDTLQLLREGHSLQQGEDCGLEIFEVQWFSELTTAGGV